MPARCAAGPCARAGVPQGAQHLFSWGLSAFSWIGLVSRAVKGAVVHLHETLRSTKSPARGCSAACAHVSWSAQAPRAVVPPTPGIQLQHKVTAVRKWHLCWCDVPVGLVGVLRKDMNNLKVKGNLHQSCCFTSLGYSSVHPFLRTPSSHLQSGLRICSVFSMPGQDFPGDWPHPSNFFLSAPSFFRVGATAMQGCCSRASCCCLPRGFWQHPQGAHAWLRLLLVRNLCQQLARCCHVPPAAAPFQNNTCPCSEHGKRRFPSLHIF